MSSTRTSRALVLHPDVLANALDMWALRREKILALLDVRAARKARKLACTCRLLAEPNYASEVGEETWRGEWLRTREEVLATLSSSRPQANIGRPPAPSQSAIRAIDFEHDRDTCPGFFGDSLSEEEELDAPTRSIDWGEVELTEGDRPTRVVAMQWPEEQKVA